MGLLPVEEIQQGLVDLYGMGPADTVRSAFDDHKLGVFDESWQALPRGVVRENPESVNHDRMQSSAPLADPPTAIFQFIWNAWSLTRMPPSTST
ncbi:MAG: hypothetical protein ACXWP6_00385, partial [Ktedonobacterales bacterium]